MLRRREFFQTAAAAPALGGLIPMSPSLIKPAASLLSLSSGTNDYFINRLFDLLGYINKNFGDNALRVSSEKMRQEAELALYQRISLLAQNTNLSIEAAKQKLKSSVSLLRAYYSDQARDTDIEKSLEPFYENIARLSEELNSRLGRSETQLSTGERKLLQEALLPIMIAHALGEIPGQISFENHIQEIIDPFERSIAGEKDRRRGTLLAAIAA